MGHLYASDNMEALRKNLEKIVEDQIVLNPFEVEQNVLTMRDAVCCLIRSMRQEDDLFNAIFQRTVYTGSYYEGLRVHSADEFDLNMVLRLPFNKDDVMISIPDSTSAYVTYQLRQDAELLLRKACKYCTPYTQLLDFFDNQRFLVRNKVQSWFHSVIERAISSKSIRWPRTVTERKLTWFAPATSPAFTCQFTSARTGKQIDVDFSPVIDAFNFNTPRTMYKSPRFTEIVNQPGQKRRGRKVVARSWFLVPKALAKKGVLGNDQQSKTFWRMAFPEAEKLLLHNTGCLRKIIKTFKLLRDCNEEWRSPIASYYLKTLFVEQFDENPSLTYWSDGNLGAVFMEMLKALQTAISTCSIPYYFNREADLLDKLDPTIAINIYNRINRIINLLRTNPNNIQFIFSE